VERFQFLLVLLECGLRWLAEVVVVMVAVVALALVAAAQPHQLFRLRLLHIPLGLAELAAHLHQLLAEHRRRHFPVTR
jgi:hypothetical protein